MNIKYFSIPELGKTGRVKALYTTSRDIAWTPSAYRPDPETGVEVSHAAGTD